MSNRCGWVDVHNPVYVAYHDQEWGIPQRDCRALWELLCLEGFQAGLSWITILRKREAFRSGFAGFDPEKVALFDEQKIESLLADPGIVRSRAKIVATIQSAQIFIAMEAQGERFSEFVWAHVSHIPVQNTWASFRDAPTQTQASDQLSKALKKRGFKYCGPVITYAFMQAAGLVNDHEIGCHRFEAARNSGLVLAKP